PPDHPAKSPCSDPEACRRCKSSILAIANGPESSISSRDSASASRFSLTRTAGCRLARASSPRLSMANPRDTWSFTCSQFRVAKSPPAWMLWEFDLRWIGTSSAVPSMPRPFATLVSCTCAIRAHWHEKADMRGRLLQINVSPGGMPKLPVLSATVTADGVAGDWQRNRKHHGGPDRAVCIFSQELYDELRDEGVETFQGQVGENFTTCGIDLRTLAPGMRLRVGEKCTIEITGVRIPCGN